MFLILFLLSRPLVPGRTLCNLEKTVLENNFHINLF
ncbi:hypothetical protein METHPM2_790011 [Pseudomonas sp. PM2]